jgi:hypothetical protein
MNKHSLNLLLAGIMALLANAPAAAQAEKLPNLVIILADDLGERFDLAAGHPDVIADIQREVEKFRAALVPGKRQY